MRLLAILLILVGFFSANQLLAQTMFTKEDKQTSNIDSAYYQRHITRLADTTLRYAYAVKEVYKNNSIKTEGFTSSLISSPLLLEGQVQQYYENGQLKSKEIYEKGTCIGRATYYHKNGKLQKEMSYGTTNSFSNVNLENIKPDTLFNYYDSLGNILVQDGNGYFKESLSDFNIEGNYKNGLRIGKWNGMRANIPFEEIYDKGHLKEGFSTLNGDKINYNAVHISPEYPGGINNLRSFIGRNYNFPELAMANEIEGNLVLRFVVEKNGTIADAEIIQDLGYGTGEEALRILKKAEKFKPGLLRGIPVRIAYNLPIKLKFK